ncbi:MAG: N-acetyl-gamma-glutamyl-phosphate reductase, partial [Phycisphaeraceae bacterium]
VYGLPELNRDRIVSATLVANPGCYPTAAGLAVAPLLARSLVKRERIIVNAATGVTGAGRKAQPHLHFPEQHDAFVPYGTIGGHRHQVEIEQTFARVAGGEVHALFVPHLLPVDYGILETIYLDPHDPEVTEEELFDAFADAYADEPFVRVRQELPNIKHVVGTNYCDLTVRLVGPPETPTVVVFSAIDNIIKGASGQAVQNMNLLFELDETAGLI